MPLHTFGAADILPDMPDWNPEAYAQFRDLRLRPALDLLAQVGDLPAGAVIDLGCGDGAVAGALRARFGDRRLVGVDGSAAMLAAARGYDALEAADIAAWKPAEPPALIFSNAALHWLGDHARLIPRLAGLLAPGGTLAVQMPRQQAAPSHALMREIAARVFPERFAFTGWQPQVAPPEAYAAILAPLGDWSIWETEYLQRLAPAAEGHPVRQFTASTALRPFVERMDPAEAAGFVADYDAALAAAYPLRPDGGALFPFRRLFFTLRRG
jgi:trans-aconitate 2-methyltransferase